uniref:Uncharacterized protein n=1 Tax=Trichuris muris TaxID=70415 RepID=A0A5S6QFA7_TRIMR
MRLARKGGANGRAVVGKSCASKSQTNLRTLNSGAYARRAAKGFIAKRTGDCCSAILKESSPLSSPALQASQMDDRNGAGRLVCQRSGQKRWQPFQTAQNVFGRAALPLGNLGRGESNSKAPLVDRPGNAEL